MHWVGTPSNTVCDEINILKCVFRFHIHLAFAFVLFMIVGLGAWLALRRSTFFGKMGIKTHATLASYALSMVHHIIAAPLGLWALWVHTSTGTPAWSVLAASTPWSIAYLAADFFIYAIPTRDVAFTLHHSLGLALSAGLLYVEPAMLRWVPLLYVCEFSSFGMCLTYVLRKIGRGDSVFAVIGQAWFVIFFFLFRIVNFCSALSALLLSPIHAPDRESLGPAMLAILVLIAAMQLYWFYKILAQVWDGLVGTAKGGKDAVNKAN